MKKSCIEVHRVTFFGYEVLLGKWRLCQTRNDAVMVWIFPTVKKRMQSFLGAALFFHHHILDYAEWSSALYETTNQGFDWEDKSKWKRDYYESSFTRFQKAIMEAVEDYFPNYE